MQLISCFSYCVKVKNFMFICFFSSQKESYLVNVFEKLSKSSSFFFLSFVFAIKQTVPIFFSLVLIELQVYNPLFFPPLCFSLKQKKIFIKTCDFFFFNLNQLFVLHFKNNKGKCTNSGSLKVIYIIIIIKVFVNSKNFVFFSLVLALLYHK